MPINPLPAKTKILEYEIIRAIGQGGFGTTYLCQDLNLQRVCVLKEFTPREISQRRSDGFIEGNNAETHKIFSCGLASFLEEARKLAKFNHPNIVKVHRFIESLGTGFIVMDYEPGGCLRELIKETPEFSEKEIDAILSPLCEGLKELHGAGIIHRDIKPENILIRHDGSPVLIDFGAAANIQTKHKDVIATFRYAPIEQFHPNGSQGPWTDIYAIGATAYELISGKPPVTSIERLTNDTLEPASETGRGRYSDRLLGLIDKSLAMDPQERPLSIDEFVKLLKIDNDNLIRRIIHDNSLKFVVHFMNWANPNPGLYVDEFVAFAICFPILDLSWRMGEGSPTKSTFLRLYRTVSPDILQLCRKQLLDAGFSTEKRKLTLKLIEGRLDEYAAAYLLDRQEEEWIYLNTRNQVARNCIAPDAVNEKDGFMALMEDVIDRSRGRVKKEFRKAFSKVVWLKNENGWEKRVQSFD